MEHLKYKSVNCYFKMFPIKRQYFKILRDLNKKFEIFILIFQAGFSYKKILEFRFNTKNKGL